LSEYILERLSSKSEMVLTEFSIIRSFPKRFKYKMSVPESGNEMTFLERDQAVVNSPYCLPSAKVPSHIESPRGMSRTLPMIGYPFGPGGSGRERLLPQRLSFQ